MNDGAALGLVLDQVSKDKNIDRAVLVETLEQAILTAAKRAFGMHREMEAKFNEETGRVDLFQIIVIVDAGDAAAESSGRQGGAPLERRRSSASASRPRSATSCCSRSSTATKDQAKAEEQDEKYGELLKLKTAPGRGSAASPRRPPSRSSSSASARPSARTSSTSTRTARASSSPASSAASSAATSSSTSAAPRRCCRCASRCRARRYRAGDRIVAYVVDIDTSARGPQIILSRTHKGLLEKLFEMEVPEIYEKHRAHRGVGPRAGRARRRSRSARAIATSIRSAPASA